MTKVSMLLMVAVAVICVTLVQVPAFAMSGPLDNARANGFDGTQPMPPWPHFDGTQPMPPWPHFDGTQPMPPWPHFDGTQPMPPWPH